MLIQNRSRYTLLFLIAITLSSSASGAFERPRTSSAISIDSKIIGYLEYLPAEIKTTFILVETDEIVAENTISTDCLIQRARAAHSSFRCDALYLHDVGTMYIFEHQINTASGEISSEMHTLELGAESLFYCLCPESSPQGPLIATIEQLPDQGSPEIISKQVALYSLSAEKKNESGIFTRGALIASKKFISSSNMSAADQISFSSDKQHLLIQYTDPEMYRVIELFKIQPVSPEECILVPKGYFYRCDIRGPVELPMSFDDATGKCLIEGQDVTKILKRHPASVGRRLSTLREESPETLFDEADEIPE